MRISLRSLLVFLLLITLFQSCKKDDELGLDLIDLPGDRFGFGYNDTSTVIAYSVIEDSIQTSGVFLNLLGSYADPVFGRVTSGIYTQALLSTNNVSFGTNPVGDSLVLTLQYNGYYGDSLASHRLKIYEIDQAAVFSNDSVYYSNMTLPLGELLFDQVVTFNPKDSVELDGKKVQPLLKVNLGGTLMQRLLAESGGANLASNDAFRTFFKGLFITVEEKTATGEGSIAYFNMNADLSRVTLYYHNSLDTLVYPFIINDQCAKFSHFDHAGYQHAELPLLNQDTLGINPRLYLQAMAGVKIRVKLPHAESLKKDGAVAIGRAELVVKVDPADITAATFKEPAKLAIARISDEGKNVFISDFLEGDQFQGGSWDATRSEYRFRVTRYMQDLLNGKFENHGLVLLVSGSSVLANRVAVLGNTASEKNLRLEIVYAKP
ncbi:MAG: DUF4270 domain-containing protein [Bacteroidales bacterium]